MQNGVNGKKDAGKCACWVIQKGCNGRGILPRGRTWGPRQDLYRIRAPVVIHNQLRSLPGIFRIKKVHKMPPIGILHTAHTIKGRVGHGGIVEHLSGTGTAPRRVDTSHR